MSVDSGTSGKIRVGVYGSCVSRDSLDVAPPERWQLSFYVARQTIAAQARPITDRMSAVLRAVPLHTMLSSPFQARMVQGDFEQSIHSVFAAHARRLDLLLLDLTDERLGLVELEDGTLLTHSLELGGSGALATLPVRRHISFGEPDHLECFALGLSRVIASMKAASLFRRTLALAIPYAGSASSPLDGKRASELARRAAHLNTRMAPYLALVESAGLRTVTIDPDDVEADVAHRWGVAPFHYTHRTYSSILKAVPKLASPQ